MLPDRFLFRIVPALVLLSAAAVRLTAADILVWDNDRDATVFIKAHRRIAGTEVPVREALEAAGHDVTVVKSLPDDLERYDAVFIMLGFFCPM